MYIFSSIRIYFLIVLGLTTTTYAHDSVETVKVEGRQINLIGDAISASQGVIGQAEIDRRPLLRTGEILESIPGLVVTQHSGSGKANQFFLRGFNLDHGTDFNSSIDGMPVNLRSHGHGQGYTDLNFIIPETVNKIQFQKGPYYTNVGDFSSAGSANISTLSKTDQGQATLSVGENDFYRAVLLDSLSVADSNFLYGLEIQQYDGPWTDINEDIEKFNGLLKYQKNFNMGQLDIGLMFYDNQWNSADQIPQRAVDEGLISDLGSIDPTVGGETSRNSLNLQWQTEKYFASAYFINYDLNLWSNFTYFLNDRTNGDQFEQVDDRSIYGGEFNYLTHGHVMDLHVENTFGIQLRIDDIDEVGLYQTLARERIGVTRSDSIEEQSISVFWENRLEISSSLRTIFGIRHDSFSFDVQSLVTTNSNGVDLTANSGDESDSITSIKGSIINSFSKQWEGYFSFGEGFHSNDARGTVISVDPESGDPIDPVDPLVESFGYEFGVRGFIKEKLNTSLAVWFLELDSELLFVGDAGNTEASRGSDRNGIEATVYYRFNDIWAADFEFAWSDAEFSQNSIDGNQIPGSINTVIQAGINYENPNGWFSQLRLRHFGERPLIEDNSVKSDSSTVINLRAGYEQDNWAVKADVLNLLDSDDHDIDYFYESQLQTESEPVEDIHFHVLEPRTVRLSFTVKF